MNARTTMNGKPVFRVPVKTILNLHSGFGEKLLSDGPALALGDACAYRCAFCYVPAIYQKLDRVRLLLAEHGLKHEDVVILREAALDVLRSQLVHAGGKNKFPDPADKRVVYMSPADDVAANMDLVRATVEAVALILRHTHWQVRLLSKSNLLPRVAAGLVDLATRGRENDHGAGFSEDEVYKRTIYGFSTGTLDDAVARAFEEGTPLVSKRIEALRLMQDNGFRTFAMVCPSLPLDRDDSYRVFAHRAAELLRYDRCEHVWAEVINLRGESFTRTIDALRSEGLHEEADRLVHVTTIDGAWETYNRATFAAHVNACHRFTPGKLRFLTYATPKTRPWWERQIAKGAVILGHHKAEGSK